MRYILAPVLALLIGMSAYVYYRGILMDASQGVSVITGTTFVVPHGCKRLALLGSTPHPTVYLSQKKPKNMVHLLLTDLFDLDYLKDSFSQVLKICADNNVDHLLIAYLPIYFMKMRQLLKERFAKECYVFLQTIAPQVADFIRDLKKELGITVPVTIVVPPRKALERIPHKIDSSDEYARYLIKQFPHLEGIDRLKSILIINNKSSSKQDEGIINYLRYEYLFEPPVLYTTSETTKKSFHMYITQDNTYGTA